MSPNQNSHLQAISHAFNLESWARHDLIVPLLTRLPQWALVTYGVFALACRMLREIFPQESADRRALWRYVLRYVLKRRR